MSAALALASCGDGGDEVASDNVTTSKPTTGDEEDPATDNQVELGLGVAFILACPSNDATTTSSEPDPPTTSSEPDAATTSEPSLSGNASGTGAAGISAPSPCTFENLGDVGADATLSFDEDEVASIRPSQGSCGRAGGTITCDFGSLGPGERVTLDIEPSPAASGRVTEVRVEGEVAGQVPREDQLHVRLPGSSAE